MKLSESLLAKKKKMTENWYKAIIDTFPADSSKFFIDVKDQFANPMGYAFREDIPAIFDFILGKGEEDQYENALKNIIRIRAVQKCEPDEAVSCIFLLKKVIREEIEKDLDKKSFAQLLEIESKIDQSAGLAFNFYMEMKEKLYEIKANEIRNTFGKMVDKLNAKYDKYKRN